MVNNHHEWGKALGKITGNGSVVIYFSPFGRADYIKFQSFEELAKWEKDQNNGR